MTFMRRCSQVLVTVLAISCPAVADTSGNPGSQWQPVVSTDGSGLTARHEAAAVVLDNALYLIGGRGNRPVERLDLSTGHWQNLGLAPLELHHVQPVVIGKRIYVMGAFTCCYPREELVGEIHVFDTETGLWSVEGSLPDGRVRGSVGAVVREGKIYLLGGNTQGHDGGAVAWFDEYDPETGNWLALPDAPNARDHFSAVMVNDQLIAAAGRQTALPSPAANPVLATDIYDFATGQWTSAAEIPTARGGAVAVTHGQRLWVAGGEINTSNAALDVVEAFDTTTGLWESWPSMISGRHGSGGGVVDGRFYMLSGATTIGGAMESSSGEFLLLAEVTEPEVTEPEVTETEVTETEVVRRKSGSSDVVLAMLLLLIVMGRRRVVVASPSMSV